MFKLPDLRKIDWEKIKRDLKFFFWTRIDVYFYMELLPNYFLGLVFFTFLMMLNNLFFLVQFYVEYNVPIGQVFLLLVNQVPFILSYTIPIGILPAYLLTMGRFSLESEITAMKSCGISALRIIRPGIVFGIAISIFAILFSDLVVISANLNYVKLKAQVMSQRMGVELKERAFVEVGGYKISFERMDLENNIEVLYNIHVVDINGRKTIEAEKGRFYTDPENMEHYVMKFMNGSISEVNKSKVDNKEEEKFFVASFRYLSLHTYVNLPQEYYSKGPDTMTIGELQRDIKEKSKTTMDQINNYLKDKEKVRKDIDKYQEELKLITKNMSKEEMMQRAAEFQGKVQGMKDQVNMLDKSIANYQKSLPSYYIMKLYEKFALPIASFVFALMSLSIGMYTARSGRNEGLGLSIVIMLVFYGMKIGTENLVIKGIFPPIMEWGPDLFFFIIGMSLLIRKIKD